MNYDDVKTDHPDSLIRLINKIHSYVDAWMTGLWRPEKEEAEVYMHGAARLMQWLRTPSKNQLDTDQLINMIKRDTQDLLVEFMLACAVRDEHRAKAAIAKLYLLINCNSVPK